MLDFWISQTYFIVTRSIERCIAVITFFSSLLTYEQIISLYVGGLAQIG